MTQDPGEAERRRSQILPCSADPFSPTLCNVTGTSGVGTGLSTLEAVI